MEQIGRVATTRQTYQIEKNGSSGTILTNVTHGANGTSGTSSTNRKGCDKSNNPNTNGIANRTDRPH